MIQQNRPSKPGNLIYGLEDHPPRLITLVLAFQHVIILAPRLLYPVIIVQGFGGTTQHINFDNVQLTYSGTGTGGSNSVSSTSAGSSITVNPVDDAPTGSVTISGTLTEDQVLTAGNTLADEDGLGPISYQWQRNGVDIGGATSGTYTLTQADVGTTITVVAS